MNVRVGDHLQCIGVLVLLVPVKQSQVRSDLVHLHFQYEVHHPLLEPLEHHLVRYIVLERAVEVGAAEHVYILFLCQYKKKNGTMLFV